MGISGYQSSFSGVKRPQPQIDHKPPSSAEMKNEWSYTFSPPICLHGIIKDNLTFHLYLLPALILYSWCMETAVCYVKICMGNICIV